MTPPIQWSTYPYQKASYWECEDGIFVLPPGHPKPMDDRVTRIAKNVFEKRKKRGETVINPSPFDPPLAERRPEPMF